VCRLPSKEPRSAAAEDGIFTTLVKAQRPFSREGLHSTRPWRAVFPLIRHYRDALAMSRLPPLLATPGHCTSTIQSSPQFPPASPHTPTGLHLPA
jgi:hypothetical protein